MKAGAALGGATLWRCLAGLGYLLALAACLRAQQPAPVLQPVEQKLPSLTVGNVIAYALQNNPGLAVKRHERGIASARVVIANTYPFNPVSENRIQAAFTPNDPASTTFNAPVENLITWEVEVRQQRRIRKEMAAASLTRTEWEIAFEEQTVAIQVIRAFYNVVYRQQKLELLEKTLRVNQRLVEDVERLIKTGKLRLPDKIVAQIEVSNTQDQLASGHEALTAAWQDLYRAMGPVGGFEIMGHLELPPLAWNPAELCDLAVTRRADVNARRLAISEASAKTRLTVANRF